MAFIPSSQQQQQQYSRTVRDVPTSFRPFAVTEHKRRETTKLPAAALFTEGLGTGTSTMTTATAITTTTSTTDAVGTVVFEPIMPSTETLAGMGIIVVLCFVVGWVWANIVVPTSRTNLAISKSRGEVKEYLDELKASDPDRTEETVAMVENLSEEKEGVMVAPNANNNAKDDRAFERWLFTDWLQDNKSARKAGRQKEPALPVLKDAKWNSGDNPILVATALISLGVLFMAVTERVASLV